MGLTDYLNDKLVGKLMDRVHGCLAPGGAMIQLHQRALSRKTLH